MNKFKYFFILLIALTGFVSCNKDDDDDNKVVPVPIRDYAVQYKADNDSIEKYLKTNYIEVDEVTFDVKITKIPVGGTQTSIWDQTDYPLETRDVYNRGVNYKVYYLTLQKGTGEAPCNFDKISVSYTGNLLDGTVFDTSNNLATNFDLDVYSSKPVRIDGWPEILPKFNTGKSQLGDDGVIGYTNFGAGVMFLPSGLAYYASASTSIPAYSPLVFSFKLYELERADHDADGVLDFREDINGDGYIYEFRDKVRYPNPTANLIEDTDQDGIPDFLDIDDDGDGYTTRSEITKPATEFGGDFGPSRYFPFEKIDVVDDPSTPKINESLNSEPKGIPAFVKTETVDGVTKNVYDYTTLGRLKIHLDKDHNTTKVTTVTKRK